MFKTPQHDFRSIELNPDLLLTPFKIQTNWHVITGAPSCGKTTLIEQFTQKGFKTVPETARLYIKKVMSKGQIIHPILADPAALQRKIIEMQLDIEDGLEADDVLFLDGAVPGSLAYYRACGLDPNGILLECFHHRYASVFVLAPLPFQSDAQRVEEIAAIAGYLDEWHTRDYIALGYDVVRVPVLPPEERLEFVLERLSARRLP
jgi:predicted ATPase